MARAYRPEPRGLRALAAALVVIYRVWLGRVSGGVGVFFVISGFLLWPPVGLAVVWAARRLGAPVRVVYVGTLTVLLAGSLAQSVWLTSVNQPLAYFDTFARAWEFALGGYWRW